MIVSPSRTVRLEVRAKLAATFNAAFSEACHTFGVVDASEDTPAVNFDEQGRSYFEARLDIQQLLEFQAPESWPALSVYVDGNADDDQQSGCSFAGRVQVTMHGFLRFPEEDVTDNEAWADAFESALITSLYAQDIEYSDINFARGSQMARGDLFLLKGFLYQQLDATLTYEIAVR